MKQRTKLMAAHRLRAYASSSATKELIKGVEGLLAKHGVNPDPNSPQYPRKYIRPAPEALFDTLKKDFEKMGFKFRRSALHKMDTKAVESDGTYQSINYILDLVYLRGQIVVELHH